MTARPSPTAAVSSPSLALAHERIADLRAAAERAQLVRLSRPDQGDRGRVAWPAHVVAALRDSLAGALPGRGEQRPCPTC